MHIYLMVTIGEYISTMVFLSYEELMEAFKRELDHYIISEYVTREDFEEITIQSYDDIIESRYFNDDNFCIRTSIVTLPKEQILNIINNPGPLVDNGLDTREDREDGIL